MAQPWVLRLSGANRAFEQLEDLHKTLLAISALIGVAG
jgi:hypothetical protein